MRTILIVLVLMLGLAGFAQQKSLYTNEPYQKLSYSIEKMYWVSFEISMYRLTFAHNTPKFLKPLITRFLKQRHRNYTHLGTYNIKIMKKRGAYYLVVRESPEKLILLE